MNILITGGAGFIGVNTAMHFLEMDYNVHVLDNLSREGVSENLAFLEPYSNCKVHIEDIRNQSFVYSLFESSLYDVVIHLAAQTTITDSIVDPVKDFEINARGTLNLLEAIRRTDKNSVFLFSSSNKVYEPIPSGKLKLNSDAYHPVDSQFKKIDESFSPSVSETPYASSKRAAEDYIQLYNRFYNIPTVIFRQSCVYGIHQMGVEEQGWVTWFTKAAHDKASINIFGDGYQVRDILYISDLVDVYDRAIKRIDSVSGEIFNIGGGLDNSLSLIRLVRWLEGRVGQPAILQYRDFRPGDQLYYVSDISKAWNLLHWSPSVGIDDGLSLLLEWII